MEVRRAMVIIVIRMTMPKKELIDLLLRATFSPAHPLARRDVPVALARALNSLVLYLGERPRLPFTARIERAQFHRARSASKKGTWPLPPHPLRPRVARAKKIISLHPSPFLFICLSQQRLEDGISIQHCFQRFCPDEEVPDIRSLSGNFSKPSFGFSQPL